MSVLALSQDSEGQLNRDSNLESHVSQGSGKAIASGG